MDELRAGHGIGGVMVDVQVGVVGAAFARSRAAAP